MGPNYIDTFVLKNQGTYHAFLKNETTRYVEHATAAKVTGPWTFVGTGNWAGWGSGMEGPCVTALDDGTWRMYLDGQGAVGFLYSDSRDLMVWSKTAPLPMLTDVVRHGTVIRDEPAAGTGGAGGAAGTGGLAGTRGTAGTRGAAGAGGKAGAGSAGAGGGPSSPPGAGGIDGGTRPPGAHDGSAAAGGSAAGAGGVDATVAGGASGKGGDGSAGVGGAGGPDRQPADAAPDDGHLNSSTHSEGCTCSADGGFDGDFRWTAVAIIAICWLLRRNLRRTRRVVRPDHR